MTLMIQDDHTGLDIVAQQILAGNVVALPTDTLYGLACDCRNSEAVQHIYQLKHRPSSKAIPLLVDSLEQASTIGHISDKALLLANKFWPGPLTLVIQARKQSKYRIAPEILRPDGTIALRIAAHHFINQLLAEIDTPLAVTSANISGCANLLSAQDVAATFTPAISVVVQSSCNQIAVPSTIVQVNRNKIEVLRKGAISEDELMM